MILFLFKPRVNVKVVGNTELFEWISTFTHLKKDGIKNKNKKTQYPNKVE